MPVGPERTCSLAPMRSSCEWHCMVLQECNECQEILTLHSPKSTLRIQLKGLGVAPAIKVTLPARPFCCWNKLLCSVCLSSTELSTVAVLKHSLMPLLTEKDNQVSLSIRQSLCLPAHCLYIYGYVEDWTPALCRGIACRIQPSSLHNTGLQTYIAVTWIQSDKTQHSI